MVRVLTIITKGETGEVVRLSFEGGDESDVECHVAKSGRLMSVNICGSRALSYNYDEGRFKNIEEVQLDALEY